MNYIHKTTAVKKKTSAIFLLVKQLVICCLVCCSAGWLVSWFVCRLEALFSSSSQLLYIWLGNRKYEETWANCQFLARGGKLRENSSCFGDLRYSIHCTVYGVQCTLYSVHCTVYSVQRTLYSVFYQSYIVHCTLYSVQDLFCTVWWKQAVSNSMCCAVSNV